MLAKRLLSVILSLALMLTFASCDNSKSSEGEETVTPVERTVIADNKTVKTIGRTYLDKDNVRWLVQSASGIEFVTTGTDLVITLAGDNSSLSANFGGMARYAVYVNGERVIDGMMSEAEKSLSVSLAEGENTVKVLKLSESANSIIGVKSISVTDTKPIAPAPESSLKIEFIGDSITCGYGVDDEDRNHSFSTSTEDATRAYAYKTAELLGADYSLVSYSGHGIISAYTGDGSINESGLVPEIYTQLGKMWDTSNTPNINEIDWSFDEFVPDIVVINLGTNDNSYVRGDADKAKAYSDEYVEFLKLVRKNNPNAHIVCTLGLMGAELYPAIETAVSEYSAETNDTNISCVKLGQIRGDEGYAADWHPTAASHLRASKEMAKHIISVSEEANTLYNTRVAAGLIDKLD
ncbi:MAG: GDSL family lipase [Oscillospiraceae bacterium]|nr:GDSL family lipase [Oscillospiraceae bacterium]